MRRAILGLVVPLMAVYGFILAPALPVSAVASCTGTSQFTNSRGTKSDIPTVGNNTHNDNCQLGVGNDSAAVRDLQTDLVRCYQQGIAEDGDFGSMTEKALMNAQRKSGATPDGIYGPMTRDHLAWPQDVMTSACAKL